MGDEAVSDEREAEWQPGRSRYEIWFLRPSGKVNAVHDNLGFTFRWFPRRQQIGHVFYKHVMRVREENRSPVAGRILREVQDSEVMARFKQAPNKKRRRLLIGWWYEVIQD